MITDKVFEIIIGIKNDSQFGPTLIIGAGGIYTELFNEITTLLLPLNKKIILEEIKKLKFSKILFGFRGKKGGDVDSLINIILKLNIINQNKLIQLKLYQKINKLFNLKS